MMHIKLFEEYQGLSDKYKVFYHGTPDKNLTGKKGIHVGTYEAAKQALNARIGIPVEGDWDGTREYGKTLLAGKKTLKKMGPYLETGYNCDAPEENYYPVDKPKEKWAKYSDRSVIPFDAKPVIFPVKIVGKMTNSIYSPHNDTRANAMIMRAINKGNAKSGFYYINDGEDSGSISAVVPDKSFLQIIQEH
jgi:hypothetical protein